MIDARWQRAKQVFHEALDKPAVDRPGFVGAACGDDPALRVQVEALLRAHGEAGPFLASPTVSPDEAARTAAHLAAAAPPEAPGTTVGPYKLLQVIGEGGFGIVYMAEQEQPIRRRVALKIIKPGMDSKEVIARFETERQALAMMDHPNIAKVLDAGATESGRPYFVMELVKGVPLTTYCDANRASTRERLDLFIQVCKAVQHAHEKGIVHRDIKPSNVMVTLHDAAPVPKIIDFGVAKATNQRLTEKTLFTAYGACIGTPTYMSPEQAEMSGLEVDKRSDVYSLGVLLYELLTGTTPFDAETLRSAAFVELLRIIREDDPPTPSARLSTLGDQLIEVARNRHADPSVLAKIVRGDLDWIVMKAIEKERGRRYDSAIDLGADVSRYLKDEPVTARRPSSLYLIGKFARRQRTPIAATASAVGAVALGALVVLTRPAPGTASAAVSGAAGSTAGTTAREAGIVTRQIWSGPAVDSYGSISPDGRLISYTEWSTGNLAIHDVTTGRDRALTDKKDWNSAEFATASAISPDGRQVAYAWLLITPVRPPQDHFVEIRSVDVNGGTPRVLFRSRELTGAGVYEWTRDGQSLVVRLDGADNSKQIALLSTADGTVRVLKSFNSGIVDEVAFSPDGKYFAYDYSPKGDPAQNRVHLALIDDGNSDTALPQHANDGLLGWSPDGTRLVVASERSGLSGIWTIAVADGKPAGEPELVKTNVNPGSLGMTRSGALYYAVTASGRDVYVASADFDSGRILSKAAVVPAPYIGVNDFPRWSPDGKSLAYLALKNSNSKSELLTTLVVRSMETGKVRELTPDLTHLVSSDKDRPLWTSDGAFIVTGMDKQGRHGIYRLDAQSGQTTALVPGRVGQVNLSAQALSADGRTLYYKRLLPESGSEAIVARDLPSGTERELLRRDYFSDVALSPDGRWLATAAYTSPNSSLLLIPVAGGEPRALLRISDPEKLGGFVAWLPDSKSLLFRKFPKGATRREPWRISIEGGPAREINLNGLLGPNPSIHPDGRQFAFVNGEPKLEIWALENFLPLAKADR